MNDYHIKEDLEMVQELLGLSDQEIADSINVARKTIIRWKNDDSNVSYEELLKFYSMVFNLKIKLNRIKEQFFKEEHMSKDHVILFHGSKSNIIGKLNLSKSRNNNDFGKGFYCGESLEQSAMFVSNYPKSSLYVIDFCKTGLLGKYYIVDREWMLTVAYFRGKLNDYLDSMVVKELINNLKDIDYIVAPIADNRMFQIIDSFIDGEITDVQCQHCLSCTNLGNQYVFKTQNALNHVSLLSHCFLSPEEKEYYLKNSREFHDINKDKVKIARKRYRGTGKYIEEILK